MTDTKKLIEFLDDTIDYLGLYSPDKDGMIHTGFTVNQITKLKQIREILEQQSKPTVTMEEIEEMVRKIQNSLPGSWGIVLAKMFKSKGVEVEEKP